MNIIEAIKARHSVRTYAGIRLAPDQETKINDAINSASSPFGGNVTIRLMAVNAGGEFRPSTYGVIKEARNYLLMSLGDDNDSKLSGGFIMEQVVLKACQLGLSTCWIGGTFKDKTFTSAAAIPDGEHLTAVSPIGQAAEKTRIADRIFRAMVNSSKRKPLGDLFFVNDFSTPLTENGPYAAMLEMMRLAPSSRNSQPWRALIRGKRLDFYCSTQNKYSLIDMGIGLCHFYLAADEQNCIGHFTKEVMPAPASGDWHYVISFLQD